jgi:hypothetical protein
MSHSLSLHDTLKQVEAMATGYKWSVETVILLGCGHSPHRDRPERTLEVITSFVRRELPSVTILNNHGEVRSALRNDSEGPHHSCANIHLN